MFQHLTLPLFLPLLFTAVVHATCPPSMSIPLCCSDLGPYSTNADILERLCTFTPPDPSTITGTFCIPRPSDGCASLGGFAWFDSCCATEEMCPRFSFGPVGINCTGTLVLLD